MSRVRVIRSNPFLLPIVRRDPLRFRKYAFFFLPPVKLLGGKILACLGQGTIGRQIHFPDQEHVFFTGLI
ncbi:hypothetical protein Y981_11250 [Leptospirillum ferriphilum YSK]|uniref:Uncharacterized protein n=1 Tax=Leptospirillum ferriphilum YSK TaxID=1441628 RepID=A0A059XXX2_9BACT|nr:hypothetical protein Y981_11250 [Leptospirillum ferriphilum YSK]